MPTSRVGGGRAVIRATLKGEVFRAVQYYLFYPLILFRSGWWGGWRDRI